jgi:hypothetical protein
MKAAQTGAMEPLKVLEEAWGNAIEVAHSQSQVATASELKSDNQDSATGIQKSDKQDGSDDNKKKPEKINRRSPKKRTCNTAALQYWAIGLEDGKDWWLFHKGSSVWEQIGKVDIPSGQLHKITEQLADGEGSVSRNELIGLLQKDLPGMNGKMVNQKVTVALSKLRKVIWDKIKVTGPFEEIDDPIPWDAYAKGWKSTIEFGYTIWDDEDDRKKLKLRSDL